MKFHLVRSMDAMVLMSLQAAIVAQLTLPGRPANVRLLAPAALSSLSLPSATTPSMCYIHSFRKFRILLHFART